MSYWFVGAPLIAALLVLIIPKLGEAGSRIIGLLGMLISLVLTVVAWLGFPSGTKGFTDVASATWFTLPNALGGSNLTIGLSFGVDGLSLPLVALTAFVALLAMVGAKKGQFHAKAYYFWMLFATAGIIGVFTALDVFTFFVALEITLFSSFFLIHLFGKPGSKGAAMKFLLYRGFATVFMLVALVGIAYGAAGYYGGSASAAALASGSAPQLSFSIPVLLAGLHAGASGTAAVSAASFPGWAKGAIFVVLLLAVFIEEAFVPFHTWLPTTHEFADTPTNMIVGGLLTKTGAYVLLRFGVGMLPDEVHRYGVLIALFGVINILYGAFVAWAQKDWRRLIAFGGISHMGLVLLGIASMTEAGLQGAMFMIVSSGLLTALLFFLTGAIEDRTQTSEFKGLGGLSKRMPILSGFLLVAALGSLGLPLTSGFISELQAFIGGFASFPALSFVGIIGLILSAVYLLYAIQKTTFGPTIAANAFHTDATATEYVPTVLLTAFVLLIGIYPNLLGHLFNLSVQGLLGIGG